MVVLTIQKKNIAQKIISGEYKANFWKSDYGCLSPRYTRGYSTIIKALEERTNRSFSEDSSPIWAWVGVPFIRFHKNLQPNNLVGMFLDIPSSKMVFSDYDKYCNYIEGYTGNTNFMLNASTVLKEEKKGTCIQACFMDIEPEQVLLTVDYMNLDPTSSLSVEQLYFYWRLVTTYQEVSNARKIS